LTSVQVENRIERRQDRTKVAIEDQYRNLHTRFRLVPKLTTDNLGITLNSRYALFFKIVIGRIGRYRNKTRCIAPSHGFFATARLLLIHGRGYKRRYDIARMHKHDRLDGGLTIIRLFLFPVLYNKLCFRSL